jgi:hypothetical protein
MTIVMLTEEDYAVINRGDPDEIKRHVNDLRLQLVQQQITINTLATDCREGLALVQGAPRCALK